MNTLEILGICFLLEITIILSLSIWTFISIMIGKKAREKREKLLDKMTSNILKKKETISDQDENIIDNIIKKNHEESDQEIIRELYNSKDYEKKVEVSKEDKKQQFFKALEESKQKIDIQD